MGKFGLFWPKTSRLSSRIATTPLLLTVTHLLLRIGLAEVCTDEFTMRTLTLTARIIAENCEENPRFMPVAAGGDGALVQYCAHSLPDVL